MVHMLFWEVGLCQEEEGRHASVSLPHASHLALAPSLCETITWAILPGVKPQMILQMRWVTMITVVTTHVTPHTQHCQQPLHQVTVTL